MCGHVLILSLPLELLMGLANPKRLLEASKGSISSYKNILAPLPFFIVPNLPCGAVNGLCTTCVSRFMLGRPMPTSAQVLQA